MEEALTLNPMAEGGLQNAVSYEKTRKLSKIFQV